MGCHPMSRKDEKKRRDELRSMARSAEYRERQRQEAIRKGKQQDRLFILCTVAAIVFFMVAFIT